MDAKFHLCLWVILLGAITVQGARPEMQEKKNPMHFLSKRGMFLQFLRWERD